MLEEFKNRVRKLKRETHALYFAARHPQTPWYAKLVVAAVVAYALSPIDLVPDFVPILGYLDDLILVPLGIAVAIKLIPPGVLAECRARADASEAKPISRIGAAAIVCLWIILTAFFAVWLYEVFASQPRKPAQ